MILGIPFQLLTAIILYIVITTITTEYLKKILFFIDPQSDSSALLLSWIVGLFFYELFFYFRILEINLEAVALFIIIITLENLIYKVTGIKKWIRKLVNTAEVQK